MSDPTSKTTDRKSCPHGQCTYGAIGDCDCAQLQPQTTEPWNTCAHEWAPVESMCARAVKCQKCGAPGDQDPETGDVFWPAT